MIHWHTALDHDADPLPAVEGGLHLHVARGRLGQSWWAQRFLSLLDNGLARPILEGGRRYARKGQLLSLDITPGRLATHIQSARSEPHRTQLVTSFIPADRWPALEAALLARSEYFAGLLAGQLPPPCEPLFHDQDLVLLPRQLAEFTPSCSCGEGQPWCVHAAALLFLYIDRLDEDPFLLFQLRGRSRDELLGALRHSWGAPAEAVATTTDDDLTVQQFPLHRFYDLGCDLDSVALPPPPPEAARVIKRLGFPPFFPQAERTVLQSLANLYEVPEDALN